MDDKVGMIVLHCKRRDVHKQEINSDIRVFKGAGSRNVNKLLSK